MASQGGRGRHRDARRRAPRGARPGRGRRARGRRRGQGRRDRRRRPGSRASWPARSPTSCRSCGPCSSRRTPPSSRSTRWSPPAPATSSPWTARSRWTRTPASATPTTRALVDSSAEDPLERAAKEKGLNYVKLDGSVGIIGNGAGLVMSTLDVVAQAGRAARRGQARQLPRHRRRRLGRGHGRRAGDHHLRRPGRERLRQRLRRDHLLRRGRQRHRQRLRAAGLPRRARDQAARRPPGRQQRRAGAVRSSPTPPCPAWSRSTPWTARQTAPPSWQHAERDRADVAIFLTGTSKVVVQGMTGSEGRKHTQRMLASGTDVVGGVTPGKGGQSVEFTGADGSPVQLPVFGSVSEAMAADRRRRHRDLRPGEVHQGRGRRGRRGRHPAGGVHHRGRAGQGLRGVLRARRGQRHHPAHRPELPRPHQPRPGQRGHHPRRHHPGRPHRAGQQVRHADLPDDVRAAGPRLHHLRRASAATRSSGPPTSTASRRSRRTPTPRPSS